MTPVNSSRRATIETAALDRTRRRLAQFFLAHHAFCEADAIYFSTVSAADEKVFSRMRRAGIIRDAGPSRYYLDLATYDAYIAGRRRLAVAVAILLALMLAGLATSFYR